MVGGVVSRTRVTVKLQVSGSTQGFVTVHDTVVTVPAFNTLPDGGTHRTEFVPLLQSPPLTMGAG